MSSRDIHCRDVGPVQALDLALHGNALDWDPDTDVVVYNARNLDTFFGINHTSGKVLWSVGRFAWNFFGGGILGSNRGTSPTSPIFLLFGQRRRLSCRPSRLGSRPTRAFGHPHHVQSVGPNRFLMFDNEQRCTATSRHLLRPTALNT